MRPRQLLLLPLVGLLAGCPSGRDDDDSAMSTGPVIQHSAVTSATESTDVPITATISPPEDAEEELPITATLAWRTADGGSWETAPMEADDASGYAATIPATAVTIVGVDYYLQATFGAEIASHPGAGAESPHRIVVEAAGLSDPAPVRARYDAVADQVVVSWTPSLTSSFVGYTVSAEMDGEDPVTVCEGGDPDGSCTVDAAGIWGEDYATWTVAVADDAGGGLTGSATTDSLHLLLDVFARETTPEEPSPFGTGQGEFFLPFGVEVHGGVVHVAEQSNHRLQSFTDAGVFVGFVGALGGTSGVPGDSPGEFDGPHDLAVGPDGNLYVADHSNARVQVLDGATRQPLFQFGTLGEGEGQLRFPVSLAFDDAGLLHVAESVNARVSVFDADGVFVELYAAAETTFDVPNRVQFLPDLGVMAVSDGSVVHLRPVSDDAVAATWDLDPGGTAVVSGLCPVGFGETIVTLDDPSTTVGSAGHRLLRVAADGSVVTEFGEWGVTPGLFWRPVDCTVDDDGNVWLADGLNHRIQLFGP